MIGIIASSNELPMVEELFELFKTPWEVFDGGKDYDLLITSGDFPPSARARAVFIFSPAVTSWDQRLQITVVTERAEDACLTVGTARLPLYGGVAVFPEEGESLALIHGRTAAFQRRDFPAGIPVLRFGYNLFEETRLLLTQGQPAKNALAPTLDLHIEFLTQMMLRAGVPVIQIPPVPAGHSFFACLTHDIDFLRLAQHRFDHTMWGFLYRALVASPVRFLRGRLPFGRLIANWVAVLKLPLVHLGWAVDFWIPFLRYQQVEGGRPSTFFLVPFKNHPGTAGQKLRATRYDVDDVTEWRGALETAGNEIAVHGIDAWDDPARGREELRRVASVAGGEERLGVRMHWLYFAGDSPEKLEAAGFDYDATCGYNDAVGWRAGTGQVFKLPGTRQLLELPFQIQDTALFFEDRMNLTEPSARAVCTRVVGEARRLGGVLTTSWHDRSLVPERQWGDFYAALLRELSAAGAWFATARQVVDWFRARRCIRFGAVHQVGRQLTVRFREVPRGMHPDYLLRVQYPGMTEALEISLCGREEITFLLPATDSNEEDALPSWAEDGHAADGLPVQPAARLAVSGPGAVRTGPAASALKLDIEP